MNCLEDLTQLDALSGALDSTRRGLASINRSSLATSALAAARSALPGRVTRPKPRRWPYVLLTVVLGAIVASVLLMRQLIEIEVGPGDGRPTS